MSDGRTGESEALRQPWAALWAVAPGIRLVYHVLGALAGIVLLVGFAVGTWLSGDD